MYDTFEDSHAVSLFATQKEQSVICFFWMSHLDSILQAWWVAGYCAMPAVDKIPVVKGRFHSPEMRDDAYQAIGAAASIWHRAAPDKQSYLLYPGSHDSRPLVIVDVDNPDWDDLAREVFGPTPLTVKTRRGTHYYYRTTWPQQFPSRNHICGTATLDVKTFKHYVEGPGSPNKVANCLIEEFIARLDALPLFDAGAYQELWDAYAGARRKASDKRIASNKHKYAYTGRSGVEGKDGWIRVDDMLGDQIVKTADHKQQRLDKCVGEYVFRDENDGSPGCKIWKGDDGQLWYFDYPLNEKARIITGLELTLHHQFSRAPDPEPASCELADALRADGIDVVVLPAEGFIDLPPADGLTILKAPHGTGKTVWARDREPDLTICNTAALAEHNADRFDMQSYKHKPDATRVSTTTCSLHKCENTKEPRICHIDEFDGVCDFFFSGLVKNARECFHDMLNRMASARECLVTSADLDYGYIRACVDFYRDIAPDKTVRVVIKPPVQGRRKIILGTLAQAKSWYLDAGRGIYGCTSRDDVSALGQVVEGCRWISSENSRTPEVIFALQGDLLKGAAGLVFSPALLSGVSVESQCDVVHFGWNLRGFPAESVGQMLMRFRACSEFKVGIMQWTQVWLRDDDVYLDCLAQGLADKTDKLLKIGRFADDENGNTDKDLLDPKFARIWRLMQRRLRRTYADPLPRFIEVCEGHGWTVIDEIDRDHTDPRFGALVKEGKTRRVAATAAAVGKAKALTDKQAETLRRQHTLTDAERYSLIKHDLETFYGLPATAELVKLDNGKKYRKKVKRYGLLRLPPFVLQWLDREKTRGRTSVEYQHTALRVGMLRELFNSLPLQQKVPNLAFAEMVMAWWEKHGNTWSELSALRLDGAGPTKDPVRWLGSKVTQHGGKWIRCSVGDYQAHVIDFEEVDTHAHAWIERKVKEYDDENS